MGLDIKIPIGFMFGIIGLFLTIIGLITISDAELYERSLNVNINLWAGLPMLVFGILMLVFSDLRKKKIQEEIKSNIEEDLH